MMRPLEEERPMALTHGRRFTGLLEALHEPFQARPVEEQVEVLHRAVFDPSLAAWGLPNALRVTIGLRVKEKESAAARVLPSRQN